MKLPHRTGLARWLSLSLAVIALAGCSPANERAEPARAEQALSIDGAEGAVCGMVVSAQPAPRAQAVHRDGTRLFLCGIADMLVHLETPSPHGSALDVWVEVMEPDEDPRDIHMEEHEWLPAEQAVYRIGDERPNRIMGVPVMVYRDRATAERAIAHGPTEILDFDELRAWWQQRRS